MKTEEQQGRETEKQQSCEAPAAPHQTRCHRYYLCSSCF